MNRLSGCLVAVLMLARLAGAGASPASGTELARLNATDLHIEVTGVKKAAGVVQYAVYDSPLHFPSRVGRVVKGEVPAASPKTEIIVKGLKPGTYAVALFHDENRNGDFDQGIFGIPLEDYGFSNNAMGFLSAPAFDDAKFAVAGQRTTISITIGR